MDCIGCGKKMEAGTKVVEVSTGVLEGRGIKQKARWGTLHENCFHRTIDSPEATLEAVKRLSTKAAPATP
jgi:hypothetical protein